MASTSTASAAGSPVALGAAAASSVGYLFLLVAWPIALVVKHTFADGLTGHPRRR